MTMPEARQEEFIFCCDECGSIAGRCDICQRQSVGTAHIRYAGTADEIITFGVLIGMSVSRVETEIRNTFGTEVADRIIQADVEMCADCYARIPGIEAKCDCRECRAARHADQ